MSGSLNVDNSSQSPSSQPQKVVIIGGSAAGAGVAAKLRRINESAHIIIIDSAASLSYAHCGIPYYIGDVIENSDRMHVLSADDFKRLLNVEVRLGHEVRGINREVNMLGIKNFHTGHTYFESYDKLVLATGTEVRDIPCVKDSEAPLFYVNSEKESQALKQYINTHECQHAVIIGAGFIGLEMAENLARLNMQVNIVESKDQVLGDWDGEMAALVKSHLYDKGVHLWLKEEVTQILINKVILNSGKAIAADVVIVAAGVKPNAKLAESCHLSIGDHGGVMVNQFLETEDPDIYALGDAIEVPDHLLGNFRCLPFAGPAQKQARVVAENLFAKKREYQAPHYSAIVKVFSLTAGMTGYSEKQLVDQRIAYDKTYVESPSHAAFYPGAHSMVVKLLFTQEHGRLLGAQIVGSEGVDKRLDVIATAMQAQMSVAQLAALDLSYAPPFSSAKDPVNVAGMVAQNIIEQKVRQIHWNELDMSLLSGSIMLDVRSEEEFQTRALPGAINIPLEYLRERLSELPKNEDIVIYCGHGKKGYFAYQMLIQHGFTRARNLAGGINVYSMSKMHLHQRSVAQQKRQRQQTQPSSASRSSASIDNDVLEIDASGLTCPGPILKLAKAMTQLGIGDRVRVIATDLAFVADVKTWCRRKGHQLLSIDDQNSQVSIVLQKTS